MRVHAIQTGSNVGNETVTRSASFTANLRRRKPFEFPVLAYLIEHPEGLLLIDTGSTERVRVSRLQHKLMSLPPIPMTSREQEIDRGLRDLGFEPTDIELVILTHLDWDHAGGVRHFPKARMLVHGPEHAYGLESRIGRLRYQSKLWPTDWSPELYALEPEPIGPFPQTKAVTESGDVRLVPLFGHTVGQVGLIVEDGEVPLFFVGDHVLRQDWFVEDYANGNLRGLGMWREPAEETSRRIHDFLVDRPAVMLPAHDTDAPRRLEQREPLSF